MTDTRTFSVMIRTILAGALVAGAATVAAAQDAKKGEELFTAQKCSMCHSVAGKGNKKYPLDGIGKLSAADLKEWLVNPDAMTAKKGGEKPVMKMKSFKTLSAGDLDSLVAYLQTLK